jgi:hypothetical protein
MSIVYTPPQVASLNLSLFKFDFKKYENQFTENAAKKIAVSKIRAEGKPFQIRIAGEITTSGINDSEFGEGKNKRTVYSLGVRLEDADVEAIQKLNSLFKTFPDDFEIAELVKDDEKIYLKLKTDKAGKNFDFKCNLNITPKKLSEASDASTVSAVCELGVYVNYEDRKVGFTVTPRRIMFDADEA